VLQDLVLLHKHNNKFTADMGGLGSIQRDATGQISGFTGGTGIASFQPYLQSIQDKSLLDPTGYSSLYVTVSTPM
jgi:hypothetical protein